MDDLSLPEVRRLVGAPEKNGGFPLKLETKAVHAGRGVDPATGAVTLPIHLSTTFERDADGDYPRGYEYTREANPNRDALEECVRELEGGAAAAAFSSGMAATVTVLQTLSPGDHVVVPDDTYFGTREIFRDLFSRWGVETSFIDMTNAEEVGGAVRPSTRLFWVETPSNPRLKITDVREISGIAREAGALLACDNTWATPVLQRPLELGADLVVHATTKYLGGHSDVMGGGGRQVRRRTVPADQEGPALGRGDPLALRVLADPQGHPDPALPHAGALGERGAGRAFPGRAPRGRRGLIPRARGAPGTPDSFRADVPLRRDALVPRAGGPGARDGRRCRRSGVHAGDEPRGDAQLRRAPGVHRGTGDRRPREPAEALGRARTPERPDGRPRAGPGARKAE